MEGVEFTKRDRFVETVGKDAAAKMNPQDRNRQEAIYELINTEKQYLEDLDLIINVCVILMTINGVVHSETNQRKRVAVQTRNWSYFLQHRSTLSNSQEDIKVF